MGRKVICGYCGRRAVAARGREIYTHAHASFADKWFWHCEPCDAHVGCHGESKRPLGSLANAETRRMRKAVHAAFDPFWLGKGRAKDARRAAYQWLADKMGLHIRATHIGSFDVEQCRAALRHLEEAKRNGLRELRVVG